MLATLLFHGSCCICAKGTEADLPAPSCLSLPFQELRLPTLQGPGCSEPGRVVRVRCSCYEPLTRPWVQLAVLSLYIRFCTF